MAAGRLGSWVVCGDKRAGFLDEVLKADCHSSIFRFHLSSVCLYIQLLALLSSRGVSSSEKGV